MGLKVDFVLEIHPCSFSPLQYNLLRDFWVTVGSKIQIISSCVGSYVHVQPCSEQTSYVLQSYSHYPRPFLILRNLSQLNYYYSNKRNVVGGVNKTVENCNLECFLMFHLKYSRIYTVAYLYCDVWNHEWSRLIMWHMSHL